MACSSLSLAADAAGEEAWLAAQARRPPLGALPFLLAISMALAAFRRPLAVCCKIVVPHQADVAITCRGSEGAVEARATRYYARSHFCIY